MNARHFIFHTKNTEALGGAKKSASRTILPKIFSSIFMLLIFLLGPLYKSNGQSPFKDLEALFTEPKHYIAYFAEKEPVIDGELNDQVWRSAQWSDKFLDIEGKEKALSPQLDTQVKMAWNDSYLFIAAQLQEPHVWATLRNHDEIIYYDNDFEIFIDPDNNSHQYFEIEVNAFNTIFDLFMPKPYRNGSGALISWNMSHLRSAVKVQGTINDPTDLDKSWTLEMAIPFSGMAIGNTTRIPNEGTLWRINFSRVQWDTKIHKGKYVKMKDKNGQPLPEHNWVWSPQGIINMHYPERWGYLVFSRNKAKAPTFTLPLAEKQKRYLWLIYYKQKAYYHKHGHYTDTLVKLDLKDYTKVLIDDQAYQLKVEATPYQFMAMIQGLETTSWCINQEGLIQKIKPTQ